MDCVTMVQLGSEMTVFLLFAAAFIFYCTEGRKPSFYLPKCMVWGCAPDDVWLAAVMILLLDLVHPCCCV